MTGGANSLGQVGGLVGSWLAEPTISVRQMILSSFGSYHLEEVIWFLFEGILRIIVLIRRVAATVGSSLLS
jgi:hypothetical protein